MHTANAKKSYKEDQLNQLLKTSAEIIEMLHAETLDRELSIIKKYATSQEFIDIVVLGQFKAGKSSFINSILEADILPTGVVPVTSIVTRIQFGTENTAFVEFLGSTREQIGINEIEYFITESNNPRNEKKISLVDIYTDRLALFPQIRIIDTPGIGSFYKHNSVTTKGWYPEIGLALVAISAERPFSAEDSDLLNDIKKYTPNVCILLTKTDLYTEDQLKQITEYIKKSLNDVHPEHKYELVHYSTIKDTDEKRNVIMQKILSPINHNFDENYSRILEHKIKALGEGCISYLKIGMEVCKKDESDRQELVNTILDEQLKFNVVDQNLNILSESLKTKTRGEISAILLPYLSSLQKSILEEFESNYDSWDLNLNKLSRKFESWIENKLSSALVECYELSTPMLEKYLNDIQQHYYYLLNSFKERLQKNVDRTLGIKLNSLRLEIDKAKIDYPDISVSYSFDIPLDLIWFFFPMFVFRGIFKRYFKNKIPFESEKNLNRLISDITEKVNKVIEQNKIAIRQYIHSELKTIENILSNVENESNKYERAINSIEALMKLTR